MEVREPAVSVRLRATTRRSFVVSQQALEGDAEWEAKIIIELAGFHGFLSRNREACVNPFLHRRPKTYYTYSGRTVVTSRVETRYHQSGRS